MLRFFMLLPFLNLGPLAPLGLRHGVEAEIPPRGSATATGAAGDAQLVGVGSDVLKKEKKKLMTSEMRPYIPMMFCASHIKQD